MNEEQILEQLPGLSALVIGDICLDRWCTYDPALALASAETGIPRVAVTRTESTPGAGGTVANNLASLGVGRVSVLGVVGDDGYGFELRKALSDRGFRSELLQVAEGRQTFTYTKLINAQTGAEDLPRVDFLYEPGEAANRAVLDAIPQAVDQHDLILISDQSETDEGGVITEAVRVLLAELTAVYPEKVFLADSRRRAHRFCCVALKPNRAEAEHACEELGGGVDFARLRRETEAPVLFVTDGGDGIRVFESERESFVAVRRVEAPVDICGAGDSFAAGAAAALFVTRDAVAAARFGSLAARVTIGKRGTGTANPQELLAARA